MLPIHFNGWPQEFIMLVVTRGIGEVLIIGDNIRIKFLGVRGHETRVGIEAPRNITVHREEVYERIKLERAAMLATLLQEGTVIKTDAEYRTALAEAEMLVARDPDQNTEAGKRLMLLVSLIKPYEKEHFPICDEATSKE